jgi:hypothetical protein
MNDLRVLTDAELDVVSGGAVPIVTRKPTRSCGGELKLVEEILVDLFRLLEPKQPVRAMSL